jgi:hypothetical protein
MAVNLYQGETRELAFRVFDSSGEAQDLTDAVVSWRLSRRFQGDPIVEKSGVLLNALGGEVSVYLDVEDTGLEPGAYVHELRVEIEATVATVFQGALVVTRSLFG